MTALLKITVSRYSNYLTNEDFEKIRLRITNLIDNKQFQGFLEDSVFIAEQSLIYQGEVKIIDLLLQKGDEYFIFDYKTTKSDNSIEHKNQVRHYKKAISDIFKTNKVYSYLIYLNEDTCLIDEV